MNKRNANIFSTICTLGTIGCFILQQVVNWAADKDQDLIIEEKIEAALLEREKRKEMKD